jgi:hypothetical protein
VGSDGTLTTISLVKIARQSFWRVDVQMGSVSIDPVWLKNQFISWLTAYIFEYPDQFVVASIEVVPERYQSPLLV